MEKQKELSEILRTLHFAADKHREQKRTDVNASPYINHPIEVAELLAQVGGVTNLVTLQGAILHDTIEDTDTKPDELNAIFGRQVRSLVEEITDNKSLPKGVRKDLQIEHAPHLSEQAKQIKIADLISNVKSVTKTPPVDWSLQRRQDYLAWSEKVVAGCRGCNAPLEEYYDQILREGWQVLGPSSSQT